jgi:hypothetical protein
MFGALKLATLLIEAPLGDAAGPYGKPDMIRFVLAPNILAPVRIGLGVPPVVIVSLDALDARALLIAKAPMDELFE